MFVDKIYLYLHIKANNVINMCSRRLKQAAFGRTYGPKRRIVPLDGCACMIITSRMLNALWHLTHLCLYEQ